LEYSVSELEGKVEELQSQIVVCQNSKLKIQEGVRERRERLITSIDFTISSVGSF
jgi:chaperonin cofactor prefoldin